MSESANAREPNFQNELCMLREPNEKNEPTGKREPTHQNESAYAREPDKWNESKSAREPQTTNEPASEREPLNQNEGENPMKESIKTPPLPEAVRERLIREASNHLSRDNAEEKSLRALCHAFLDKHVIK